MDDLDLEPTAGGWSDGRGRPLPVHDLDRPRGGNAETDSSGVHDIDQGCRTRGAGQRGAVQEGVAQSVDAGIASAPVIEEQGDHQGADDDEEQQEDEAGHSGSQAAGEAPSSMAAVSSP